jgi:chemotaxis protein methyltransferase CheR
MKSVGSNDYKGFISLINDNKDIYRRFIEHLTINVSEFFRNPNNWEILEKEIIPILLRERSTLKIWSAGCSTGEEAYSLAMLFKEKFWGKIEPILASDLDNEVLEKAAIGLYSAKAAQTLPLPYLNKYFIKEGEHYRIVDDIKRMVRFQRHDLLKDTFPRDYDLILCRNVVIYFTEDTKSRLYKRFVEALRPGGVLFIGSTEQIFQAKEIGFKTMATFFYQKV